MEDVSPFAEFLGELLYQFEEVKPLLPTYGLLIISALFPIYAGAHASLSRPSSAAKPPKKSKKDKRPEDEEEQDGGSVIRKMEGLEPSDAIMFPLMAGLTLGGLYLVIKWLEDPAILNKILSYYFSQMGILFSIGFLKDGFSIIRSFVFPSRYRYQGRTWKVDQAGHTFVACDGDSSNPQEISTRHSPLPWIFGSVPLPQKLIDVLWLCRDFTYRKATVKAYVRGVFEITQAIGLLDVFGTLLALGSVYYFTFVTKPWWLTNFFGFGFSYGALQFMSPSTFWTGTLILGSLFFYDIYFVFYTPLMVTVATKLDVPIKLLIPRPSGLAMLGLGDIVIPGMMVGLALRYDLYLYYRRKSIQKAKLAGTQDGNTKAEYQSPRGGWGEQFWGGFRTSAVAETKVEPPYPDARAFPKTYFHASLVGYTAGMIATLAVMQYWNHAQPALLYLVPGVLISLWGTALVKGEIGTMWSFSDSSDEEAEESSLQGAKNSIENKADDKKDHRSLFARMWSGDINMFHDSPKTTDKKGEDEKKEDSTEVQDTRSVEGEKQAEAAEKEVASSTTDAKIEHHPTKHDEHEWLSFSITIPPLKSSTSSNSSMSSSTSSLSAIAKGKMRVNDPPSTPHKDTSIDKQSESPRLEYSDVESPHFEHDGEPVLKKRRSIPPHIPERRSSQNYSPKRASMA